MIAYRYNPETMLYEGTQQCQLDPLESEKAGRNIYLLPANCTLTVPLEVREGYNIVWNGSIWEYIEIPKEPEQVEPEPTLPTLEEVKAAKINELKNIRDTKELEPILYNEHYFDFDLKSYNRITAAVDVLDKAEEEYQKYINSLPEPEPEPESKPENNTPELTPEELAYLQEIEASASNNNETSEQESESNNNSTEDNNNETIPDYPRPSIVWTTADNENVKLTADGLHGIIQAAAVRSNQLHIQYRILKTAVNNADSIPSVEAIEWDNYEDYN